MADCVKLHADVVCVGGITKPGFGVGKYATISDVVGHKSSRGFGAVELVAKRGAATCLRAEGFIPSDINGDWLELETGDSEPEIERGPSEGSAQVVQRLRGEPQGHGYSVASLQADPECEIAA